MLCKYDIQWMTNSAFSPVPWFNTPLQWILKYTWRKTMPKLLQFNLCQLNPYLTCNSKLGLPHLNHNWKMCICSNMRHVPVFSFKNRSEKQISILSQDFDMSLFQYGSLCRMVVGSWSFGAMASIFKVKESSLQSCRPRIIRTGLFECQWMEAGIWTTSSVKTYRGSCKGTFSLWPTLLFNNTPHPWQWIHTWSIQQKTVEKSRILFENFCKMPYIQLPLYQNVNGPNCYYFRSDWMHY